MKYIEITARNVLFSPKLLDVINYMGQDAANEKVEKWINSNFRNWLINDFKSTKTIKRYTSKHPIWVKIALDRKETIYYIEPTKKEIETFYDLVHYLNTEKGNISRMSVDQVIQKTNTWKQEVTKNDGVQVIHEYPNGYRWVQVISKSALLQEGKEMQNCIRDFNTGTIFSLRNEKNKPHVNIELKSTTITQIKGRQNKPPIEKYHKYILSFFNDKLISFYDINQTDLFKMGLVYNGIKVEKLDDKNATNEISLTELQLQDKKVTVKNMEITFGGKLENATLNCTGINAHSIKMNNSSINSDEIDTVTLELDNSNIVTSILDTETLQSNNSSIQIKDELRCNTIKVQDTKLVIGYSILKAEKIYISQSKVTLPETLLIDTSVDIINSVKELPAILGKGCYVTVKENKLHINKSIIVQDISLEQCKHLTFEKDKFSIPTYKIKAHRLELPKYDIQLYGEIECDYAIMTRNTFNSAKNITVKHIEFYD